jgi:hypothetical protein
VRIAQTRIQLGGTTSRATQSWTHRLGAITLSGFGLCHGAHYENELGAIDLVPARRLREQVHRRRPRYPAGYRRGAREPRLEFVAEPARWSLKPNTRGSRSRSHSRWYASM